LLKHPSFLLAVAALALIGAVPATPADTPAKPEISANAAPASPEIPVILLVDLSTGQTLFSREPQRRFMPASVTKVMTAYTAFKLIDEGKLSPATPVMISKEVADQWSGEGSSLFLKEGDRMTVGELLLGVTTVSANDAAVMLSIAATGSEDDWLDLMNANAAELGMRDSHFGSPNGYPDEGRTYTSAHDLAVLAEALTTRYPGLYHRYFGHRGLSYRNITQANHDPITGIVPGADGIKTGFTREAGYTFVGSAKRGDRRLVIVIGGAPSARVRNQTARDLMRWGFEAFDSRAILPGELLVGHARVQNGSQGEVGLETADEVLASVPPGGARSVAYSIHYRGPVEAPIAKGEQVAWLHVTVPGQQPHDVPLVAAEAVPEANAFQRLVNGVVGLLT